MSRLIDVAAILDSMAKTLAGTEQGEACAFAVRLMRERESATPAKHPDTERLDWLASNKQSGGKAFCLQWTFRDNNNQTNIRDAIDAARKQGGAHD